MGRRSVQRDGTKTFALAKPHDAELGLADSGGVLQHRVKYGSQFARRAADNFQYFGGRRLLLQRFAQLVQQACVLDRDHSLVGEISDQFNLLIREGADLKAVDADDADQRALLEHRHDKQSSDACLNAGDYKRITICIGLKLSDIVDMRGLLCLDHARETGTGAWLNRTPLEKLLKGCRSADT